MKRICYLYLLWVLCLTAPLIGRAENPWGITQASLDANIFGIDKLLQNETVYYAVSKDITREEEEIFIKALKKWPAGTLAAIKRVGRADEFKDITGLLERGISLQKTSMNRAEVSLEIDPTGDVCGQDAAGCHFTTSHRIVVRADYRNRMGEVLPHEIGHFYGLGDQYDKCRYGSSPIYSSDINYTEGSVMRDAYSTHGKLTCDDYDGFINLIDLRLKQTKGKFPVRSDNGWWSLCKKTRNFYKNAKTTNRENNSDFVTLGDERIYQFMDYDKNGNVIGTTHDIFLDENPLPLFSVTKDDRLTQDAQGRVTRIVSNRSIPFCPAKNGQSVRTFEYTREHGIVYNIHVKCNGQQTVYTLPIVKSKEWSLSMSVPASGAARMFRKEFPIFDGKYSVSLNFENDKMVKFISAGGDSVTNSRGEMEHRRVYLERTPSAKNYRATVEGYQQLDYVLSEQDFLSKLLRTNILLSHRAALLEAKDAYNRVIPHAFSFYNYFYKPTLGLSAAQQDKQQIKKRIAGR